MLTHIKDLGYSIKTKRGLTVIYKTSKPELSYILDTQKPVGIVSSLKGRSQIRIIEPDMVVRTLMHGGFFRHITGDTFLSTARSLRELEISNYLISHNLATPEILGLRFIKKGIFYTISVITRLVPDSTDLLNFMENPQKDSSGIIKATGMLISKLHKLGVYHADLHIKNILLDQNNDLWILDLDKARRFTKLPLFIKNINIRRFIHSCIKWQNKGNIVLPDNWENSLLEGYSCSHQLS